MSVAVMVVIPVMVVVAVMHAMAALIASCRTTSAARCSGRIRLLVRVPGMSGFVGHHGLLRMSVSPDVELPYTFPRW
jgi:hypothetical protein